MGLDFSHSLHECRTATLRQIDAEGKVMVSIGAAGSWYFNWIHNACGVPLQHIGVEYYSPKPADLPPNVTWVANTAGHMPDVPTDVADILFSGQNLEHLWQEEVIGFLLESHRVLRTGGLLVMDSPNRLITAVYGHAHPEHMVETTPDEAIALTTAAGFDVESVQGLFLCRDPRTGEVMSIDTLSDTPPHSTTERCVAARNFPNDSYVWWLHARRSEREPDVALLTSLVTDYWNIGWPERMNRMVTAIGKSRSVDGKQYYDSARGQPGALVFGPYAPTKAGRYRASLNVSMLSATSSSTNVGFVDITFGLDAHVKARVELIARNLATTGYRPIELEFELSEMTFGFQMRLIANGAAALSVEKAVTIEKLD